MGPGDAAAPGGDDTTGTTELDPAGVLTRSLDPGTGFVPVQSAPAQAAPPPSRRARRERRPDGRYRWWIGAAALIAVGALVVVDAVAVSLAGAGSYSDATVLAWVAIVLSGVAVLAGGVAVVLGRGRMLGAVAIVLGISANPYLLTRVLEALGG
jgi:hypothetical protein